jgi:hypothetical protein
MSGQSTLHRNRAPVTISLLIRLEKGKMQMASGASNDSAAVRAEK